MSWETKVWGRTRPIIETEFFSRHELTLEAGGYCSFHWHKERANRFQVLEGYVRIVEVIGSQYLETTLGPGGIHTVASLVAHQFQVLQPGWMLEDYWPDRGGEVRNDDIVRLSVGGKVDVELLQTGLILVQGPMNSPYCIVP